ncbi:MAG: metalloregulator ArsR/SmtB family transcription factor [Pseudomonadota bacterium]
MTDKTIMPMSSVISDDESFLATSSPTLSHVAQALSALGHEARLSVFRLLVVNGEGGLNVGEITDHLDIPASTLAHHLRALVQANLVIQERRGRQIVNRPNYETMQGALGFLTDQCCAGLELKRSAA